MILSKQMNRTNSLIILGAIMLSTFLVFNTAITIHLGEVSAAVAAEPEGYENEIEERSHDYPTERDNGYPSMMNDDYTSRGPSPSMMAERGEYDPDRYGGYYGHYEGDFYLDQYVDGNPYDGEGPPYDGKDNDESPYDGNGSPYVLG
jgi:hypothetical protein